MQPTTRALRLPGATRTAAAGFTLVEIMVTVGILLILLGFLFIPTLTAFNLFSQSSAKGEVQSDARYAMEQMSREVREAVTVYRHEVDVDYDGDGTTEKYERLSFQLPVKNGAEVALPLRPQTTWITYYVRPADVSSDYEPMDNPFVLYRAESTTTPTGAADLSGSASVHTAVTGVEDDDVERLSFTTDPASPTTGQAVNSVAMELRLRRSEYVDKLADSSLPEGPTAPRAQLKSLVRTPQAVKAP